MFPCTMIMEIPADADVWIVLFVAAAFVVALALLLGRGLTFEKDPNGRWRFLVKRKGKNAGPSKSTGEGQSVNVLNDATVGGNVNIGELNVNDVASKRRTTASKDKPQ